MKLPKKLVHKFVENLPEKLEEGTVYVCMGMATVAHNCCCGCGNEVVTPLSPTDWKLEYDGGTITLYPSIGNWGFATRSSTYAPVPPSPTIATLDIANFFEIRSIPARLEAVSK